MTMQLTETRQTTDKVGNPCVFRAGRNNGYLFAWCVPAAVGTEFAGFDLFNTEYAIDTDDFDPEDDAYDMDDGSLLEALEQYIRSHVEVGGGDR